MKLKNESRSYTVRRNRWIRKRFDELREQNMSVRTASRVVSEELKGQIAPDTVRTIIYSSNCA